MDPTPNDAAAASVRKIPKALRRYKYKPEAAAPPAQRLLARLQGDPQFLRRVVQALFVLLSVWIGIEFFLFVRWGESGGVASFHARPPGAEAFLPISGLLGLLDWRNSGELNRVHPAATVVLLAIVAVSLLVRKSFCSWLCPVGTLGDALAAAGRRLFGRNFKLWKGLDYPLRAVKYVLLVGFVVLLAKMGDAALAMFVYSDYNRMADVNMYRFFAHVTPRALVILGSLAVASLLVNRFWCRYLCPYGALLGIAGLLSPLRVTRVKATCIDCELCSRVCPSNIAVHRVGSRRATAPVGQVWSDECTTCLSCVNECPVKNTLVVRPRRWHVALSAPVIAGVVVGVFVTIAALAMATGHWQNAMTPGDYLQQFAQMAMAEVAP